MPETSNEFPKALRDLLNKHNKEMPSNTPDFILAEFLCICLEAFNKSVCNRTAWYGEQLKPQSPPQTQQE